MNKRQIFYSYTIFNVIIALLVRNNLLDSIPTKIFIASFGLINEPFKLALLSTNLVIFDLFSILLARSEVSSVERFLQIRKVGFVTRWIALKRIFSYYLVPVILVHVLLFNSRNYLISLKMLAFFVIAWIILVGLPMYKLPLYLRVIIVFGALIMIRMFA